MEEILRCNICEKPVKLGEAVAHSSDFSHGTEKAKLENSLRHVRGENYGDDSSVASLWEDSAE
jgi:hypothetical protein